MLVAGPEHRSAGIGRELVDFAEGWGRPRARPHAARAAVPAPGSAVPPRSSSAWYAGSAAARTHDRVIAASSAAAAAARHAVRTRDLRRAGVSRPWQPAGRGTGADVLRPARAARLISCGRHCVAPPSVASRVQVAVGEWRLAQAGDEPRLRLRRANSWKCAAVRAEALDGLVDLAGEASVVRPVSGGPLTSRLTIGPQRPVTGWRPGSPNVRADRQERVSTSWSPKGHQRRSPVPAVSALDLRAQAPW